MPSVFYWLGGGNNTFGTAGDWTLDPVGKAPAAGTPGAGDEAVYDGTVSSAVCAEVGAADPFGYTYLSSIAAIRAVNGYAGVLGFPRALSVGTFEMASAAAQTDQYTDLTVTGTFTWTGGTINRNTAAANLILSGATATIAPEGGGTVTTGDNLSFNNGATGTITAGTINFTNDVTYFIDELSTLISDTSLGNIVFQQPAGAQAVSTIQGTRIVEGGEIDQEGAPLTVKGTLKITESSTLKCLGGGGPQNLASLGTDPGAKTGTISIENDSTIEVTNGLVLNPGGKLVTKVNGGLANQQDQRGTPAAITGDFWFLGGDLTLDEGGLGAHVWGTLFVSGNVNWTGGTFHVTVDPNAANENFDQWDMDGSLTVTVNVDANGNPVAGAPAVDVLLSPNNAPAPNQVWRGFLFAAGGINAANNRLPKADNNFNVVKEANGTTWDLQD